MDDFTQIANYEGWCSLMRGSIENPFISQSNCSGVSFLTSAEEKQGVWNKEGKVIPCFNDSSKGINAVAQIAQFM